MYQDVLPNLNIKNILKKEWGRKASQKRPKWLIAFFTDSEPQKMWRWNTFIWGGYILLDMSSKEEIKELTKTIILDHLTKSASVEIRNSMGKSFVKWSFKEMKKKYIAFRRVWLYLLTDIGYLKKNQLKPKKINSA